MTAKYYNPQRFVFFDEMPQKEREERLSFRSESVNKARELLRMEKPEHYDEVERARRFLGVR